eukprot:15483570-Alexandrium_andersonii.AAC.1
MDAHGESTRDEPAGSRDAEWPAHRCGGGNALGGGGSRREEAGGPAEAHAVGSLPADEQGLEVQRVRRAALGHERAQVPGVWRAPLQALAHGQLGGQLGAHEGAEAGGQRQVAAGVCEAGDATQGPRAGSPEAPECGPGGAPVAGHADDRAGAAGVRAGSWRDLG